MSKLLPPHIFSQLDENQNLSILVVLQTKVAPGHQSSSCSVLHRVHTAGILLCARKGFSLMIYRVDMFF